MLSSDNRSNNRTRLGRQVIAAVVPHFEGTIAEHGDVDHSRVRAGMPEAPGSRFDIIRRGTAPT